MKGKLSVKKKNSILLAISLVVISLLAVADIGAYGALSKKFYLISLLVFVTVVLPALVVLVKAKKE